MYKICNLSVHSPDQSMSLLLYCIVLVQLICHAPRTGLNIYEIYQVSTHQHGHVHLYLQYIVYIRPLLLSPSIHCAYQALTVN